MRQASLSVQLILIVFAVFSELSQSRPVQSTALDRAPHVRKRWRHMDGRGPLYSLSHSRDSAVRERLDDEVQVAESRTDGEDGEARARELPYSIRPGWPLNPRLSLYSRLRRRFSSVGAEHKDSNEFPRQPQPHKRNSKWDLNSDLVDAMRNLHVRGAHFNDFQLGMGPW